MDGPIGMAACFLFFGLVGGSWLIVARIRREVGPGLPRVVTGVTALIGLSALWALFTMLVLSWLALRQPFLTS